MLRPPSALPQPESVLRSQVEPGARVAHEGEEVEGRQSAIQAMIATQQSEDVLGAHRTAPGRQIPLDDPYHLTVAAIEDRRGAG